MTEIETFQLPIFYNENKKIISPSIQKDLELAHTENEELELIKEDLEKEKPVYHHVFNLDLTNKTLKNQYLNKMVEKMTEYYTTDVDFLKDNQKLLKKYQPFKKETTEIETIMNLWREIKDDTGFKEKYYYIDWPIWEFLNRSDWFLQIMSLYNLSAPVFSLLLPLLILIFPFFIIKMKGMDVTMSEYISILKILVSNHAFGKLFTEFHSVELNQKIYLIISALFYIFSIYQNFLLCIRFHMNMGKIYDYLRNLKEYIHSTIQKIDHYLSFNQSLSSHTHFLEILKERRGQLQMLEQKWDKISATPFSPFKINSWNQICEIGYVLRCFYELYDDAFYNDLMEYSFEFHAYINCLDGLVENIYLKQVQFADFERKERKNGKKKDKTRKNKERKPLFEDNYYAVLKDRNPVKNMVSLEKNLIVTGPNASGKTTVLKSVLINLLLTQHFGCGFYRSAFLNKPFDHIHCYLNIPDTSGRDSLFQAEAKRCKEILDSIESNDSRETHFCAFDEIYSGTNPEEATSSTVAFINYLVNYSNVSCMLTSHFLKACKKLGKNKHIENFHMKVDIDKENSAIHYSYELEPGISNVKGGIQILKDLNYPSQLLDSAIR